MVNAESEIAQSTGSGVDVPASGHELHHTILKAHHISHAEFIVDAVLFDMASWPVPCTKLIEPQDGTLVDSIGAVEAAWGSVADEIGQDRGEVIAATHGRRAIDNLKDLKPQLRRKSNAEMEPHVAEFETKILNNADAYKKEVRSRRESEASSRVRETHT